MSTEPRRVPLPEVRDLIELGQSLPFRVLDSLGRLLLNKGQTVVNERQLEALFERGATVEYDDAEAVRKARASAGTANEHAKLAPTLFDFWEQQTCALDGLVRDIVKGAARAAQLEAHADEHIALVDRHVEAALFMCIRQDDSRFALYGLRHCQHTATVVLLCALSLGRAPARALRGAGRLDHELVDLHHSRAHGRATRPAVQEAARIAPRPPACLCAVAA